MEMIQAVIVSIVTTIVYVLLIKLIEKSDRGCIYVSYAEEDKNRAEFAIRVIKKQLKGRLRSSYKVLTAKDIPPGSIMPDTREIYLRQSDICIVFLSEKYIKNNDCNYELNLLNDSMVIPIFLNFDEEIFERSKNIIGRKGIFLVGCYSHRLIENKMIHLTRELLSRSND